MMIKFLVAHFQFIVVYQLLILFFMILAFRQSTVQMQVQLSNEVLFPNIYVNTVGDTPLNIVTNAQKFALPKYQFLKGRYLFKCYDEKGNKIPNNSILQQSGNYYGVICPQGYSVVYVHVIITLSDQNSNQSVLLKYTGPIDYQSILSKVSNFSSPVVQGFVVQDLQGNQIYLQAKTQQNSILELLTNNFTTSLPEQDQYNFGILANGIAYNQTLITTDSFGQMYINIQSATDIPYSGIHTMISSDFTSIPSLVDRPFKCFSFKSKQKAEGGVSLVAVFHVLENQEIKNIFVYGYLFDLLALCVDQTKNPLYIYNESQTVFQNTQYEDQFVQQIKNMIQILMTSSTARMFISNTKLAIAQANCAGFLSGQTRIFEKTLDGLMDAFVSQVCKYPDFAGTDFCSCFDKSVLPCLSAKCQLLGYKNKQFLDIDCNQQLQGIQLSYQDCTILNKLSSSGTINVNQTTLGQCTQQIKTPSNTIITNQQNQLQTITTPPPNLLSRNQIIIIVLICLVISIVVIIIAVMLYRSSRKKQTLSRIDLRSPALIFKKEVGNRTK